MVRCLSFVLLTSLLTASLAWPSNDRPGVEPAGFVLENGLVTVHDPGIPIMSILESLSAEAGIHIFLFEPLRRETMPGAASGMPLEQFLGHILKGHNHAVLYGPTKRDEKSGLSKWNPMGHRPAITDIQTLTSGADGAESRDEEVDPLNFHRFAGETGRPGTKTRVHVMVDTQSYAAPPSSSNVRDMSRGNDRQTAFQDRKAGSSTPPFQAVAASEKNPSPESGQDLQTGEEGRPSSIESPLQSPDDPSVALPDQPPKTYRDYVESEIARLTNRIESGASDAEYERWTQVRGEIYVTHDSERLAYFSKLLAGIL